MDYNFYYETSVAGTVIKYQRCFQSAKFDILILSRQQMRTFNFNDILLPLKSF